MSTKVDQKKYLKKYLSGDKSKKRRKKDENHSKTRVTVVDDDIGFTNRDNTDDYNDFYLTGEDAPQVVGIIDDRPPELRAIEDFQRSAKWKSLSRENDDRQFQSDKTSYKRSEIKYTNSKNYKNDQQNLLRRSQNSDSSSDLSPKRRSNLTAKFDYHNSIRSTGQKFERSLSPSRKRAIKDYYNPSKERIDKDLSPQRRKLSLQKFAKPNNEDDKFPLRRKLKNSKSSEENVSLTRKRTIYENVNSKDMEKSSTSHHPSHCLDATPSPDNTCKTSPKQTGVKRTLDGKLAGLQTAANLREEVIKTRRQNDDFFENMPTEVSGKNADIVVRSTQRARSRNRDKNKQKELEKKQHEIEKKEKYSRWGKGLKQIKLYQHKMADELHESSKPLARYSDDVDLDKMLKQQERLDDPMLVYMRQKKNTIKSAGLEVPVYKGCFPENRFNIRPGYRWDGVDRSNGYEKKLFDIQNQKKAIQEEAYRYSTEDM